MTNFSFSCVTFLTDIKFSYLMRKVALQFFETYFIINIFRVVAAACGVSNPSTSLSGVAVSGSSTHTLLVHQLSSHTLTQLEVKVY